MADYFGNVFIPLQTLEHQAAFFKIAFAQIREAQEKHSIEGIIVTEERTGNLHLIPKRALAKLSGLDIFSKLRLTLTFRLLSGRGARW